MKTSSFVAKLLVRLFFVLLLIVMFGIVNHQSELNRLGSISLYQWQLIFPVLLIAGFITLLVMCSLKKYSIPQLNWLLSLNTLMLIIYGIAVFMRITQMLK